MEALSRLPSSAPDLGGRVAVVTGGAQGIGAEIARTLAAAGASVAIWDVQEASVVSEILETGGDSASWLVDIAQAERLSEATTATLARWGRIDLLVNNAGLGDRVDLAEITAEFFNQRMGINVYGTIECTRCIYPHMAAQGGGKIVNVSSVSAKVGGVTSEDPNTGKGRSGPVYSATKGATISFTRWIAKTGGEHGILANAVCPGPVATKAIDGAKYDLSTTPVKRLGTTGDIAQAVLFLGSQMSNYITGQTLNVDGGLRFD